MMLTAIAPNWRRVTLRERCPVCGGPNDCTIGPKRDVVKCARAISDRPHVQADGRTMWLHPMPGNASPALKSKRADAEPPRLSKSELNALLKSHRQALTDDRLQTLCESLGLSERSLRKYDVGFDAETGCYSFPMRDENRQLVGFRLRPLTGRKRAVVGSRNGLFVPNDFDPTELIYDGDGPLLLLLPEGPTDCAAAAELGFRAIGRPCCNGGAPMVARMLSKQVSKHDQHDVVIFADRDSVHHRPDGSPFWPGLEGGLDLAALLLPVCMRLRFLLCPGDAKDLREWFGRGHAQADLIAEVMAAPRITPAWIENEYDLLAFERIAKTKKPGASNAA